MIPIRTKGIIKRIPRPMVIPTVSPFDLGSALTQWETFRKEIAQHLAEIEAHKTESAEAHQSVIDEAKTRLEQVDALIAQVYIMREGKPGEPAPAIDEQALAQRVFDMVNIFNDKRPKTDLVDHEAVAARVLKLLPKQKKGVEIDPEALLQKLRAELPKTIGDEEILNAVITLLNNKKLRLSIDHVDGLKEAMSETAQRAVVRGGGDTVAAGTNVTISTVNGVKTISATGGSGFTELVATETPNGSTKIFTFALASAQPSYIVSDNVWMKATSKAGTVNWTWNAGAKKATLTIPPLDDIYAIV